MVMLSALAILNCIDGAILLISDAFVLKPAIPMAASRVVMSPMDYAAFFIPFIFTIKAHCISSLQVCNSGRQINIMCYQDSDSRWNFKDKSLMPATLEIIGQDLDDLPDSL